MPLKVAEFQPTPNPNALKCILDGTTGDSVRSYFTAASARDDALARRLFEIPGVTNVLIQPTWVSVCKDPAAHWSDIKPAITRALAQ